MKKLFFLLIALISCGIFSSAFAEKIPIRITPAQIISTHHDEVKIGDWIDFEVIMNIYKDKNLFIKKGTPIIGIVDFVHENGFVEDLAEIKFKTFYTNDINNQKIVIDYPLTINQRIMVKDKFKQLIKLNLMSLFRGSEIYIEPDTKVFNIFMEN